MSGDVALVVTAHQHAAFITEALDSVHGQSLAPAQVVVVDDGSTDSTGEVARAICDERGWHFVALRPRQGVARARAAGAAATTAPRLLFVDGDDVLDPLAVESLSDALDVHPDWSFAYPTVQEFGASHRTVEAVDFDPRRLAVSNFVPATALMDRRLYERLGGFDHALDRLGHEDWDFWIRAVRSGSIGGPAPAAVLRWRRHQGAVSRNARSGRRWLLVRTRMWWRHRGFCPPPNPGRLLGRRRPAPPTRPPTHALTTESPMAGSMTESVRRPGATTRPVTVSIVVVAYHRPDQLDALLASIDDGAGKPASAAQGAGGPVRLEAARVVERVVVNVDDDPAVAAVARAHGALIVPVENLGFAAAVNAGVRVATGRVCCFMNDDLVLSPGALGAIAVEADTMQSVALPRLVDGSGTTLVVAQALATPLTLLTEWALTPDRRPRWAPRRLRVEKWRSPRPQMRVDAGSAAIVAAPTTLLRSFPLPEQYFLYWEELDWFWQLHRGGVEVTWMGDAHVTHLGGRDDVRPEKSALLARNAVRCVRSTQGWWAAVVSWPVVVLWWTRLWSTDAVLRRADPDRLASRAAGLRAALGAWRELR